MMLAIDARLNAYRTGGIATYTRELIHALETLLPADALTILEHRKSKQPVSRYFASTRVWTPPHHPLERVALSLEIAPRNYHLLHSPDFIPPAMGVRKRVITVHDLTFLHYPETLTADSRSYYNNQIKAAVEQADHILTVSQSSKRDLIEMLNVPTEKITVTLEGVSDRFKPMQPHQFTPTLKRLGLPTRYFLHVGTWEPRKNLAALAHAYSMVLSEHPDSPPLLLAGRPGWNFDTVEAEITSLKLPSDKLIWHSDIEDDDLVSVFNGCHCTITPSLYEGFGLPALEGMACGKLPLVSNRSSLPEVVADVGLQFDPRDAASIAAAMLKTLNDPLWVAQQNAAALVRAQQFSWSQCAVETLAVYQSL